MDLETRVKSSILQWPKRLVLAPVPNSALTLSHLLKVGSLSNIFSYNWPKAPDGIKHDPFYTQMFNHWNHIHSTDPTAEGDIRKELIWNNRWITNNGKTLQRPSWEKKELGLFKISAMTRRADSVPTQNCLSGSRFAALSWMLSKLGSASLFIGELPLPQTGSPTLIYLREQEFLFLSQRRTQGTWPVSAPKQYTPLLSLLRTTSARPSVDGLRILQALSGCTTQSYGTPFAVPLSKLSGRLRYKVCSIRFSIAYSLVIHTSSN